MFSKILYTIKSFLVPEERIDKLGGANLANLWPVLLLLVVALPISMPLSHICHTIIIAITIYMVAKKKIHYISCGFELPYIILLGSWFLTVLFSPEPGTSIVYMKKLTPYLLLFLLPNLRLTQKAKIRLITIWLLSAMIHSIYVIGQFLAGQDRPGGIFGSVGFMRFAHFVYIPLAVCLTVLCLKVNRFLKSLSLVNLLTGSTALFATYTRGAWIAYIGGIGVFLFLKKKWILLVSCVLLMVILIGVVLTVFPQSKLGESIHSIVRPFDPENYRVRVSNSHRVLLWQASVNMLREHPIFGIGPLRFRQELNNYLPDVPEAEGFSYNHAHSIYFDTLATMGLVGFGGLIIFLVALFYVLLKEYWRTIDAFDKSLLLAAIVSLVCLCIGGLTGMCFRRAQTALNLSLIIGLALGGSGPYTKNESFMPSLTI